MPNVKIKSMNGVNATEGITLADHTPFRTGREGKTHRQLEPGEVVTVPDDQWEEIVRKHPEGAARVEITQEPATRPLFFKNRKNAFYTQTRFRDIEIEPEPDGTTSPEDRVKFRKSPWGRLSVEDRAGIRKARQEIAEFYAGQAEAAKAAEEAKAEAERKAIEAEKERIKAEARKQVEAETEAAKPTGRSRKS